MGGACTAWVEPGQLGWSLGSMGGAWPAWVEPGQHLWGLASMLPMQSSTLWFSKSLDITSLFFLF